MTLVSLMAMHARHVVSRSKFKISQWRMILEDVLGAPPRQNLRTLSVLLSELCEAVSELLLAPQHRDLTGVWPRPLAAELRRAATCDRALCLPDVPLHIFGPQGPTVVKKLVPRRRKADKKGACVSAAAAAAPAEVPSAAPLPNVTPAAEPPPPPAAPLKGSPALLSTVCPSSALFSAETAPEPPADWQISVDDEHLVFFQTVCVPCVSFSCPAAASPCCGDADESPCPMAVAWESSILD